MRITSHLVGALAFILAVATATRAADIESDRPQTPAPTSATTPAPRRVTGTQWWKSPSVIKTLKLTDEQRAEMDCRWSAFFEKEDDQQRVQKDLRKRFLSSLRAGEFEKARTAIREWDKEFAQMLSSEHEIKIDILSLLTPEQFREFMKSYSALIQPAWSGPLAPMLSEPPPRRRKKPE